MGLGVFLLKNKTMVVKNDGNASRSLNSAELKYCVIDKEATAIMFGIKKWNQYLFCNKFTLVTDHKPLISIFGPKKVYRLTQHPVYNAMLYF